MENFRPQFESLVRLYERTKEFILRAEQLDPDSSSNISVFKEQRDALDHVMRSLSQLVVPQAEKGDEYVKTHFDKATGHLYRAAYDALDGIGVSCKLRINEAMKGVSNQAISEAFPEWWNQVAKIDKLDQRIAEHRAAKDIGQFTNGNLEAYSKTVDEVYQLTLDVESRARSLHDWQRREDTAKQEKAEELEQQRRIEAKHEWTKTIVQWVVGGIVIAVITAVLGEFAKRQLLGPAQQQAPKTNTTSATVPANR